MKNYPRIKRLSTLGIVHHQEFDYEFNAFRTDFVGEGGAGKSMISDLLQLIFVGTSVFHSPTKSTGDRKAHTMVIKSGGHGTDLGYAFLNIETANNRHIIIGIYLESTGHSNAFIIQSGFTFNEEVRLMPFDDMLCCTDFIKDDAILPLDALKAYIYDTKGLTCESWQQLAEYHKILYNNYILPLDLSKSRKTLENYAKIIQAFSREALDISKSEKLQSFLFGDEKEKEFVKDFERAIDELSGDVKEFENNSEEIEKLTHKQEKLQELLKVKMQRDDNFTNLIKAQYIQCSYEITEAEAKRTTLLNGIVEAQNKLLVIKDEICNRLKSLRTEIALVEEDFQAAIAQKSLYETKSNKLSKYFSWLKHFNCSNEDLVERYDSYHKSKANIETVRDFKILLTKFGILEFAETLELNEQNALSKIQTEINELTAELSAKEQLRALNNIDDKNSLAYWALTLGRKLTLDEESIVHKYHNESIIVSQPHNIGERYIPDPIFLLTNIKIKIDAENGFWLNLGGLHEYIPTVTKRIFHTEDIESIRKYFEGQSRNLDSDIASLKTKIDNLKNLHAVLENLEEVKKSIKSWNLRHTLDNILEIHDLYEATRDQMKEYSGLLIDNLQIAEDTKLAKAAYKTIDETKTNLYTLQSNLQKLNDEFVRTDISKDLQILLQTNNINLETEVKESFLSEITNAIDYFSTLSTSLKVQAANFSKKTELDELGEQLAAMHQSKKELSLQYPEIVNTIAVEDILPQSQIAELEQFDKLYQNNFKVKFTVLVDEFLKSQSKRFENSDDFIAFCSAILPPEIFDHREMLDEEIIENINKRLRDINQQNQNLNGRKLQKLSNIIDQVDKEVSDQLNDIRGIKSFFNEDGMVITGGHKVYLEIIYENVFPRIWMHNFTQQINSDFSATDEALFTPSSIATELEQYPTLLEKMRQAFAKCGGSNTLKPDAKDLLNPKSYYDLKFSIMSANKKKNDGSTSQTYAAISLLCMARLGLLDRTQAKGHIRPGIRFMAIDEAEGLGSNFDLLYKIAKENDYQILSLSINPNKVDAENQNIYLLMNSEENEDLNYRPVPIFGTANNPTS